MIRGVTKTVSHLGYSGVNTNNDRRAFQIKKDMEFAAELFGAPLQGTADEYGSGLYFEIGELRVVSRTTYSMSFIVSCNKSGEAFYTIGVFSQKVIPDPDNPDRVTYTYVILLGSKNFKGFNQSLLVFKDKAAIDDLRKDAYDISTGKQITGRLPILDAPEAYCAVAPYYRQDIVDYDVAGVLSTSVVSGWYSLDGKPYIVTSHGVAFPAN